MCGIAHGRAVLSHNRTLADSFERARDDDL